MKGFSWNSKRASKLFMETILEIVPDLSPAEVCELYNDLKSHFNKEAQACLTSAGEGVKLAPLCYDTVAAAFKVPPLKIRRLEKRVTKSLRSATQTDREAT